MRSDQCVSGGASCYLCSLFSPLKHWGFFLDSDSWHFEKPFLMRHFAYRSKAAYACFYQCQSPSSGFSFRLSSEYFFAVGNATNAPEINRACSDLCEIFMQRSPSQTAAPQMRITRSIVAA